MKCSCNLSINRFQCDSQPQSSSYVFSKEHCVHAFLNLFCGPCLPKDNRGFTGNQTGPICRYLIYYRSDALTQEPGGCVERVLVSRQPIYRTDMAVLGYELLFRDSEINRASFSDGDQATAEVILNTFMDIGLQEVVGQDLAFINFRSEEHTSELQSRLHLVCRLLLEKKKNNKYNTNSHQALIEELNFFDHENT